MNEKEKMINGYGYNPCDKTLFDDRIRVKTLCWEYNKLSPKEIDKKKDLIKNIVGKCGENFCIEPSFQCDYGYNIELGENFYSNHNLVILDCAKVKFGNNVFVAPNCGFYTACHPVNAEKRINGIEYAMSITVGNNVWIGGNVAVLAGVTIGDNTVIGAGSVVTKDIPSNVIAVGNPCRVLKEITEDLKEKYKVL